MRCVATSRPIGILWRPVGVWPPPCAPDLRLVCSWVQQVYKTHQCYRSLLAISFTLFDGVASQRLHHPNSQVGSALPCMQASSSGRHYSCDGFRTSVIAEPERLTARQDLPACHADILIRLHIHMLQTIWSTLVAAVWHPISVRTCRNRQHPLAVAWTCRRVTWV